MSEAPPTLLLVSTLEPHVPIGIVLEPETSSREATLHNKMQLHYSKLLYHSYYYLKEHRIDFPVSRAVVLSLLAQYLSFKLMVAKLKKCLQISNKNKNKNKRYFLDCAPFFQRSLQQNSNNNRTHFNNNNREEAMLHLLRFSVYGDTTPYPNNNHNNNNNNNIYYYHLYDLCRQVDEPCDVYFIEKCVLGHKMFSTNENDETIKFLKYQLLLELLVCADYAGCGSLMRSCGVFLANEMMFFENNNNKESVFATLSQMKKERIAHVNYNF